MNSLDELTLRLDKSLQLNDNKITNYNSYNSDDIKHIIKCQSIVREWLSRRTNNNKSKYKSSDLEDYMIEEYIKKVSEKEITMTQPGSVSYLMFGSLPSEQSISIKMGKIGEEIIKKIIIEHPDLELLKCGTQCIDKNTNKKKDLDLLWIDKRNKTIYYREAKSNIELDSEKLPATIDKVLEIIDKYIKPCYPDYTIDVAIFNWAVYNRQILKKGLSQIKKCESKNIKVEHPEDIFKLLDFNWSEENYYEFFRKVGNMFRK